MIAKTVKDRNEQSSIRRERERGRQVDIQNILVKVSLKSTVQADTEYYFIYLF